MNIFLNYQYWVGFSIGLSILSMLVSRKIRTYAVLLFKYIVLLFFACLMMLPLIAGFFTSMIKIGFKRGEELYDEVVENL